MKHAPDLDRVVATSHAALWRATLLDPAGAVVTRLPLSGGTVRGSAIDGDRWAATVTLPGVSFVPDGAGHELAGFTGHRVRLQAGAVVDQRPVLVTVADLLVTGSTVTRDAGDTVHTVTLGGLAGHVAASAPRNYAPTPGETCQAMIRRVVDAARPAGWAPIVVVDTSPPAAVPAGYAAVGRSPWDVVEDLAAIANVTVYVDAVQRLVIRPPLSSTPAPVRTLTVDGDVTALTVDYGRDRFANRVELRCRPVDGAAAAGDVVGVAELTGGPTGTTAAGPVVSTVTRLTGTVSQAQADARAAALLAVTSRAWLTVDVAMVPDPRIEPDDDVLVDGWACRVSELTMQVGTGPTRLALRTLDAPTSRTAHGRITTWE